MLETTFRLLFRTPVDRVGTTFELSAVAVLPNDRKGINLFGDFAKHRRLLRAVLETPWSRRLKAQIRQFRRG